MKTGNYMLHKLLPILIIFVAIPLFIYVILHSNLDLRRFASGDPVPTITPVSSAFPSPVPSSTSYPSPTSIPNISPKPIPGVLTITTTKLPTAYTGRSYNATVSGSSSILDKSLKMDATGLPSGLTMGTCTSTGTTINCPIIGKPSKIGYYKVKFTLKSLTSSVNKTLPLYVIGFPKFSF